MYSITSKRREPRARYALKQQKKGTNPWLGIHFLSMSSSRQIWVRPFLGGPPQNGWRSFWFLYETNQTRGTAIPQQDKPQPERPQTTQPSSRQSSAWRMGTARRPRSSFLESTNLRHGPKGITQVWSWHPCLVGIKKKQFSGIFGEIPEKRTPQIKLPKDAK